MWIGRLIGWLFLIAGILTSSADLVMAFAPQPTESLMAIDLWVILSGRAPTGGASGFFSNLMQYLLHIPAWLVLIPFGGIFLYIFKRRPKRRGMLAAS
jgi:hypothetical protein